jgi:hypothetical protein
MFHVRCGPCHDVMMRMKETASKCEGPLRIYRISSRGQPTKGSPLAREFGVEFIEIYLMKHIVKSVQVNICLTGFLSKIV